MPNASRNAKPRTSTKPRTGAPHEPAFPELADIASMQAISRGDANEDQQRRALAFIIERICATYDLSYRPGDAGAMTFAEGKRFVGLQLVALIKTNLATWSNDNAREQFSPPREHE